MHIKPRQLWFLCSGLVVLTRQEEAVHPARHGPDRTTLGSAV